MTTALTQNADAPLILTPEGWQDYRLLDSGDGRKLEQVGPYRFIRPEAQALWPPALPASAWDDADGEFVASASQKNSGQGDDDAGKWRLSPKLPPEWIVSYDGLQFMAMPTPFRHLGFFPEQSAHWQWCAERCRDFTRQHGRAPKILNLFGYTGVASLHAAANGADVTHVDSSKKAIAQAFENRNTAGLSDAPIRFITEDARSFVKREARRERTYDGVILDPPKYGRGAKGEVWRMEDDIAPLLHDIAMILSEDAQFVVLTSYAIRSSFLSLHHVMDHQIRQHPSKPRGGIITSGELAAVESNPRGYRIGQAIFARWQA